MTAVEPDSLLLALSVRFRRDREGRLCFEKQACNGLELWAGNFRRVVVAGSLEPAAAVPGGEIGADYQYVEQIPSFDRIEFVPLPWGYGLGRFMWNYRHVRAIFAEKIRRAEYLSFAIGGLIGDWPSVAALEATRQGRQYSVWTDRVEHEVVKRGHLDCKGPKRLYRKFKNNLVISPLMKGLEHHIISKSDLGLFHGRDTFDAYSHWCRVPRLVHNIHLKPEDRISRERLAAKIARIRAGGPLRLIYAGRASELKGPMDWVGVMAELRKRGVPFHALWLGDGPLLATMRAEVSRLGLNDVVELPGHVADRGKLLRAVQDSDLFVFCHKTLESPRCLIEALMCASPIVGYDSPYPRDLLEGLGDGLLVPRDDPTRLAARILGLHGDREGLSRLVERCDELGSNYSDQEVFRHRSELIKEYLGTVRTSVVAPVSAPNRSA